MYVCIREYMCVRAYTCVSSFMEGLMEVSFNGLYILHGFYVSLCITFSGERKIT